MAKKLNKKTLIKVSMYWTTLNMCLFSVAAIILLSLKISGHGLDVISLISVLISLAGVSILILASIQYHFEKKCDLDIKSSPGE